MSFPSWRRAKPDPPVVTAPTVPSPPSAPDALIMSLTPPNVPHLATARLLARTLGIHANSLKPSMLQPVLASLCSADSPVSFQAAGFDIMSAYWENSESLVLTTADRLTFFSLILRPNVPWVSELWESRFKALRAFTRGGTEVLGMEVPFVDFLKSWIQGAFEGLLVHEAVEYVERAERERSIEILSVFLNSAVENPEIVARMAEEQLASVLYFYAGLVDRSIDLSPLPSFELSSATMFTAGDLPPSTSSTPSRPSYSHRRNPSSMSIVTLPSPSVTPSATPSGPVSKHPADIAANLYLNHLASQLKALTPNHLDSILLLLFRTLAFYASPLRSLSMMPHKRRTPSTEDRITETLDSLFAGPYSTTCMMILKRYIFPPANPDESMHTSIQISLGAFRNLRNYIRKGLSIRLARAYISREYSIGYSHSGSPGHMDVERDLMERAWPKDDVIGWDAGKLGRVLCKAVEAWVQFHVDEDSQDRRAGRERILEEAAGILKDVLHELDSREKNATLDDDEASAVGETLYQLARFVLPVTNRDGTTYIMPLSQPIEAPTPFLRILSSLLARDHSTHLNPLLSTTLLLIADHLTDVDTAKIPVAMSDQHDLTPTSPEWLSNWASILGNPIMLSISRPLTRLAVMNSLQAVYDSVKDMPTYRQPLADVVLDFLQGQSEQESGNEDYSEAAWLILSEEVVLRTVELESLDSGDKYTVEKYLSLLEDATLETLDDDDDTVSVATADTHSPSPPTVFSSTPSTAVSPILSRMQSEAPSPVRERESGLGSSVMSIFTSLATGSSSRSQSSQPLPQDEAAAPPVAPPPQDVPSLPRTVRSVGALVVIFSQLAFTPFALEENHVFLAKRIFAHLVTVIADAPSLKARLAALQFLMRLRADRDHRLYFVEAEYDPDGHVFALASLINRSGDLSMRPMRNEWAYEEFSNGVSDFRKARARTPQERDGRKVSRGFGGMPSGSASSRSRSRPATHVFSSTPVPTVKEPLWRVPEQLPFAVKELGVPSESIISFHLIEETAFVLPIDTHLSGLLNILETERSWEILSYVLCHLPVQLANKHLFCGPKCRQVIAAILKYLCAAILDGTLASNVELWPAGLKARDAQGLAYHTLSVLIGYRRCLDIQQRHLLVEVLQSGLNAQSSTTRCCLHALSIAAFELSSSLTRCLQRVLDKLSRIMSNPDMAVHILGFLSIVGSHRELQVNFTEGDYKTVFGVALQYLQHQNRLGSSPTASWTLSQHVRILSYRVLYCWFLAVRLADRPGHVRYITRQLLLANEGKTEIDEPTEVCFDWLARYAYASADPRPTDSLLTEIVMNPSFHGPSQEFALKEKTWMLGNSVVTIRVLAKSGWVEVNSRRPSGCTKFLCRVENVPLVGPGDVEPDMLSIPAAIMMDHDPPTIKVPSHEEASTSTTVPENIQDIFLTGNENADPLPSPDPITGYVWSGTAPSQRRKEVAIDPAFFALQLSGYPDHLTPPQFRTKVNPSLLPAFVRSLDRMPVIDTHKVGVLYVAPGQRDERDILSNTHGSPAYTRFLEGIGRLISLRGQVDVYAGGLDPDEDGEYAYAWWDDIAQILFYTATMMPSQPGDEYSVNKKRHIGNDYVRIVWNDSGLPYRFDTLATQFQFVNIVVEPHSLGAIAAFSNNLHENEYFKLTVQRAPGMAEFAPVGEFKLISAEKLPLLVRQLSLLADWFASIFKHTKGDTERVEMTTNWHARLRHIQQFRKNMLVPEVPDVVEGIMGQEAFRDFTTAF